MKKLLTKKDMRKHIEKAAKQAMAKAIRRFEKEISEYLQNNHYEKARTDNRMSE